VSVGCGPAYTRISPPTEGGQAISGSQRRAVCARRSGQSREIVKRIRDQADSRLSIRPLALAIFLGQNFSSLGGLNSTNTSHPVMRLAGSISTSARRCLFR